MAFKCSICYPDKEEIQYPERILSADDVRHLVKHFPWKKELEKLEAMNPGDIHYNPSIDFINTEDGYSFCLTAEGYPDEYYFSVWYKRPVQVKSFWGGEKVKWQVVDKAFNPEDSFELLEGFLLANYPFLEENVAH